MDQITVVIPTQSRLTALERTLAALERQELGELDVRMILVCSGRNAAYRDHVRALAAESPFPAKVIGRTEGGAAGARNAGVGVAETELILFLNDDTPPLSQDLVRSHAERHDGSDQWGGVLGQVVWDPEIETNRVMDWLTRTGKMNEYTERVADGENRPMLYAPNLSLHKSAFIAVGGFDERFWRYGWAEYDLALRLYDRGFKARFVPELVVGHHHRYALRDSLRRSDALGLGANLFNRVHGSRDGLVTPAPTGLKGLAGRMLAPLAAHTPVPSWLPRRAQDGAFKTLHFAMLARGYARDPVPEGAGPQGGIPGPVELLA